MGGSRKTITDLQRSPLYTEENKGKSWRQMMQGVGVAASKGGPEAGRANMSKAFRDLKNLYPKGLLDNFGYGEVSSVIGKEVNIDELYSQLHSQHPTISEVVSAKLGSPTAYEQVQVYLQDAYPGYSIANPIITIGGVVYTYSYFVINGTSYDIVFTRDPMTTINEYVIATYSSYESYVLNSYSLDVVNGGYPINVTYSYMKPIMEEQCTDITDSNGNVIGQDCQMVQVGEEEIFETVDDIVPAVYHYTSTTSVTTGVWENALNYAKSLTFIGRFWLIPNDATGSSYLVPEGTPGAVEHTIEYTIDGAQVVYSNTFISHTYISIPTIQTDGVVTGPYMSSIYQLFANDEDIIDLIRAQAKQEVYSITFNLNNFIVATYVAGGVTKLGYLPYSSFTNLDNLIVNIEIDILPHIPLKYDKAFTDDTKLNILLGKVGLKLEDLKDSLSDDKINSAYLDFGIQLNSDVQACQWAIVESFKYIDSLGTFTGTTSRGLKNYSMSYSYKGMRYSFHTNYSYNVYSGNIANVGDVVKTVTYRSEWDSMDDNATIYTVNIITFKRQLTATTYDQVVIDYSGSSYTMDGRDFPNSGLAGSRELFDFTSLNGVGELLVIPIFREVFRKMPANKATALFEEAIHILVYVKYTIKIAWYQTMFFRFVVSAILIYLSGGSAGPVVAATATTAVVASIVFQILAQILPAEVVQALAIIYAIVTFDPSKAFDGMMATAVTLANAVSMAIQIYAGVVSRSLQNDVNSARSEMEQAQEELDAMYGENYLGPIPLFNYTSKDPNEFFYMAKGDYQYNYDILYDYDTIFNKDMPR